MWEESLLDYSAIKKSDRGFGTVLPAVKTCVDTGWHFMLHLYQPYDVSMCACSGPPAATCLVQIWPFQVDVAEYCKTAKTYKSVHAVTILGRLQLPSAAVD